MSSSLIKQATRKASKDGSSSDSRKSDNVKKSKSKLDVKKSSDKVKDSNKLDTNTIEKGDGAKKSKVNSRRIMIGAKLEDAYNWNPIEFESLESPCSLQEYLQDLIRRDPTNIDKLLNIPENQSPDIWLYEHLRQICLELNYMVVQLQSECNSKSCPEMKAGDFFFLCASHLNPNGCCAIDYTVHTLDGAISLLNNQKYFPSRITVPSASIKHFLSISRRLYRIFAHAFYHHKEVFEIFENQYHLYRRFLKLSKQYSLIPDALIIIPEEEPARSQTKDKKAKKSKEEVISLNVNLNPNLVFAEDESKDSDDEEFESKESKFEMLVRSDTVVRRD